MQMREGYSSDWLDDEMQRLGLRPYTSSRKDRCFHLFTNEAHKRSEIPRSSMPCLPDIVNEDHIRIWTIKRVPVICSIWFFELSSRSIVAIEDFCKQYHFAFLIKKFPHTKKKMEYVVWIAPKR